MTAIGIVGPGRAGQGLALALTRAGHAVQLHGRRRNPVPPPLTLTWGVTPPWIGSVEVILLAVRDGSIAGAAAELARSGLVGSGHVVLHLSGLLDETPLAPLRPSGPALGVFHPLQAIARPEAAPERLHGALAALTGDARAVEVGERLARSLGMHPVRVAASAKARYHAAAAIASNYTVVLAAIAERIMAEAGIPVAQARRGIATLVDGTLANVRSSGAAALTGPIVRGDVDTVRAHLAVLPPDVQAVYRALGRATLALAKLEPEICAEMREVLGA